MAGMHPGRLGWHHRSGAGVGGPYLLCVARLPLDKFQGYWPLGICVVSFPAKVIHCLHAVWLFTERACCPAAHCLCQHRPKIMPELSGGIA